MIFMIILKLLWNELKEIVESTFLNLKGGMLIPPC